MATNYSCVLTTTPTRIMPAAVEPRSYLRISNPSASGSAWLSHLVTNPAPNMAGSYEVPPGGSEEFASRENARAYVPAGELWGVAVSGTVQLTVEAE